MSGSAILDIVIVVIALFALVSGWRQGGASAFFSMVGVLLGGIGGLRLLPMIMEHVDGENARFVVALLIVAGAVLIGYTIGSMIGNRLRDTIRTRAVMRADSAVGALVQVVTTLLVVWLVIVPVAGNNSGDLGRAVRGSSILSAVSNIAPSWLESLPSQTASFFGDSGFPVITDPFTDIPDTEVDAPDNALTNTAAVQQARPSVVRVVGEAEQCNRILQGTGFAIDDDLVMTNAHVVAGTGNVMLETTEGEASAQVVYYNPEEDIALVRTTDGTTLPPLNWSEAPGEHNQDAIVMGFPLGGDFQATPARIREQFVVSGPDIYAATRVDREAYTLRGTVVQGNSGGPLIDTEGNVLGLIFGAAVGDSETGYALTKDEVLSQVGDMDSHQAAVDTEKCVVN
ncbi:MAG TPA: MarP family serine protease [Candidatus Corynebacterium avicola]|uniref:MarP family serine protease n=1 Tax=Candidatus Corynebacterium avicola TaxID=2838527 RepID=A0A9D1RSN1_9CORY|nr:MarP family serine protease [Candidatus Corynebacterium avicola]